MVSSGALRSEVIVPNFSAGSLNSGIGCSPDSSTRNESSSPRPVLILAVGSRKLVMSVESRPGKSPPPEGSWRRRRAAIARPAIRRTITAAGKQQFAANQSSHDPDAAAGAGFFGAACTGAGTGAGSGVGSEVAAGGGRGAGAGAWVG